MRGRACQARRDTWWTTPCRHNQRPRGTYGTASLAKPPYPDRLPEREDFARHLNRSPGIWNVPSIKRLVETLRAVKHHRPIFDVGDIPVIQRLVEAQRIGKHLFHIPHTWDIPVVQRLVDPKALKSYFGTGLFAIIIHPITFYCSPFFLDMSTLFY